MAKRVRVYIASSIDGFIAGPNHDISWLPTDAVDELEEGALSYDGFLSEVGALLMGRSTFDVVSGFEGPWPYGELPVIVATNRELELPAPSVETARGPIEELVALALERAQGKDVYLDGGDLIRQAVDAGLVDEMVVTLIPILLGRGQPLFAGLAERHELDILGHHRFGDRLLQLVMRPRTP